ncbi:hypothetical protein KQI82_04895 [Oscillibacter sp. MSJ-2]|uniref:Uncharacterized protein n=1 Tax=Dysosmobacter acutus TaxID=2841504 RepID=A0ABS6F7K3_9FIRM|nr:hypothetical protein [Dysosmobacter acutus]MBU5626258.1 hypothetical protein [Dysosmobacter acutus]
MDIRKEREGTLSCPAAEADLELINQLSKGKLSAEQVYTFGVRLCDNEVDRDYERFDEPALHKLGDLFVGKSGIFDHQWASNGQTARIYRTEVCFEPEKKTSLGEVSCYLKGYAYMLRSEKNKDLIAEIEGGIKKEVSVGCSVERSVCSICGSEMGSCAHQKGETYGGKLCFAELRNPTDAYEWSFVAVPAQRRAGVIKRCGTLKQLVEAAEQGACLEEWKALQQQAELGRKYLGALRAEVSRLAALTDESLNADVFSGIADKLSEPELLELKRVYEKQMRSRYPLQTQLRDVEQATDNKAVFLV